MTTMQVLTMEDHEAMGSLRHYALVTKWMRYVDNGILRLAKVRYVSAHKNWKTTELAYAEEIIMHRALGTTAYTNELETQVVLFDNEEDARHYVRYKKSLIASAEPDFLALWPTDSKEVI